MSYEGFEQHICKSGHRFDTSCSYSFEDGSNERCPVCGSDSVFCNAVDQTNGADCGIINDWDFCQLTKDKYETCAHCNHTKVIETATYRVPNADELKEHRMYWDDEISVWRRRFEED